MSIVTKRRRSLKGQYIVANQRITMAFPQSSAQNAERLYPCRRGQWIILLLVLGMLSTSCSGSPAAPAAATPSAAASSIQSASGNAARPASATSAPDRSSVSRSTAPSVSTPQTTPPGVAGSTPTSGKKTNRKMKARHTGRNSKPMAGLHVDGNKLLNGDNKPVRLLGVNRSGTEYACIGGEDPNQQGWGFFEGPADAASVKAIASWGATAVRLPLNETCWLGINGASPEYSGVPYRKAIADYVALLNRRGLAVILELHWSAAGTAQARSLQPMPNRDHSVSFWTQVARAYKGNTSVVFDLFNEPYPDDNRDSTEAWRCWRDGGKCPGVAFEAAGMQELVTAVRKTGATNVIMLGGVQYSNSLSQWLDYKPSDPVNNLAAAWHVYNFNSCNEASCWDRTAGVVAERVPLVAGEIGADDGSPQFMQSLMDWHDRRSASYLAWVWNTWGSPLDLIQHYNGKPTVPYGATVKQHLTKEANSASRER